ncbi:UNVERIFIED_CONTAM: hypothetical protein FKN15_013082 [Acipenser sinensis]
MDMLPKPKYSHLRNESVSSVDALLLPPSPGGYSSDTQLLSPPPSLLPLPPLASPAPFSPSSHSLTPILPPDDSPTTLCSFFPRMGGLRLSGPGGLLPGLRVSRVAGEVSSPLTPSPLPADAQDMNRLGAGGRRTRVEGGQLGGDEWTRHGSFVNKPTRGWLHSDTTVMGPGVSYQVRPSTRSLSSILGKSNLQFAGMSINLSVSTSSLNLMATDCKQGSGWLVYSSNGCVAEPFEDALRVPAAPPMEEQLRRELWFHGKASRKEAEKLLQGNGDFLVRESTTTPGQYVLTGLQGGHPKHLLLVDPEGVRESTTTPGQYVLTGLQGGHPKHLLLVDPEGVVRTKDHRFESVSHLISYHMDNHLPIISAGSEVCLQQPVERRA